MFLPGGFCAQDAGDARASRISGDADDGKAGNHKPLLPVFVSASSSLISVLPCADGKESKGADDGTADDPAAAAAAAAAGAGAEEDEDLVGEEEVRVLQTLLFRLTSLLGCCAG